MTGKQYPETELMDDGSIQTVLEYVIIKKLVLKSL